MKIEIDDKIVAEQLAEKTIDWLYDSLEKQEYSRLWYNEAFESSIKIQVEKLFIENKDKIINAIVERTAEKLQKNISLRAVLALLGEKNGKD